MPLLYIAVIVLCFILDVDFPLICALITAVYRILTFIQKRLDQRETRQFSGGCVFCIRGDPVSNPSDKVMECDNCAKHFCANCINMPETVYEYMATTSGIWCCDKCTVGVKALMKKPVNTGTTDEISKMKVDLDTTMNSVKTLMDDFYYFMNGTKVKSGVTPETKDNETSTWKTQSTVARPLKEIILEAGAEQKKEQDEDLRRRKNGYVESGLMKLI